MWDGDIRMDQGLSCKGPQSISGFMGHIVSVITMDLHHSTLKASKVST